MASPEYLFLLPALHNNVVASYKIIATAATIATVTVAINSYYHDQLVHETLNALLPCYTFYTCMACRM